MIVWSNGCYDLGGHNGHFNLLLYARNLANCGYGKDCKLIIGIDSDEKIKKTKGFDRPIFSQEERKDSLLSIIHYAKSPLIDEVYIFNSSQELEKLIKKIEPDAMVIGSDWKGKYIVGQEFVRKGFGYPFGIHYFQRTPISTSQIIKKIKG